jgi:hypothetical protein
MGKKRPALTLWAVHDDGFHRRIAIPDLAAHASGIFIGSDPENHVVLDDPSIERFAAQLASDRSVEIVAGVAWDAAGNELYAGDVEARLPVRIGAWTLRNDPDPENATISIWRDALLELRTEDADALLQAHDIARLVVDPKPPPAALVALEARALMRLEDPEHPTVYDLGAWRREGFTIGGDDACDIVHAECLGTRVRFELDRAGRAWIEILAGYVEELTRAPHAPDDYPPRRMRLPSRWTRLQVGALVVQLCRWPTRAETVRRIR